MRLTVIGCSGSYPGPDSPASCYLLEAAHDGRTWRLLLDLGNGALGVLHRFVDPAAIDGVVVSHLHADHCMDLCGYYVMRKYHPTGVMPQIPVWGPDGTARRMAKAYGLDEDPGMSEEFDFLEYSGEITFGPFRITPYRVCHPVPAYALRVEVDGCVVTYSGDTGPCPALDRAAAGSDVFLCEASFVEGGDNPPDLHMTGADAGRSASAAGVGRLVLTHIPPWHDPAVPLAEAVATFDGPVDLAEVGAVYEL